MSLCDKAVSRQGKWLRNISSFARVFRH